MKDIITDEIIMVRSKSTGKTYYAKYVVECPAGQCGMVWAWININTEFGIFMEAYKPTIEIAIESLQNKLANNWERA